MLENQYNEKKSLRLFTRTNVDWKSLAKDCVCFANARGGIIAIGIEDDSDIPPEAQEIFPGLIEQITKRISELTVNVGVKVTLELARNGGKWIKINIFPSVSSIASTTDGQYYIRISDDCKPVLPDELSRLHTDKPAFIWETKVVQRIKIFEADKNKLSDFLSGIRLSKRVSEFVKQKSDEELLSYYQLIDGELLTNLGVLWIGKREQRAKLMYAPVVQFIKYDENGNKVKKILWDDFSLNPKELIEDIWEKIPDWKEGIEVSEGIFGRKIILNYNEDVVRELLSNALVHRPYTTRGDIFVNLYHNRLEVHNPGLLPLGVTPNNILHQTVKRNEHLSKLFYDLNLMEREGSGFDKMYEIQLQEGKNLPGVQEGNDRVTVVIEKQIKNPETLKLVEKIKSSHLLNQKEIICLGIIAQNTSILATEFTRMLQISDDKTLRNWLGKLLKYKIVLTRGRTKGTQYYISPQFLKGTDLAKTNLKKIDDYRIKQLIIEDVSSYPFSRREEIHSRIGQEIPLRKVRKVLYELVKNENIKTKGGRKFRQYFIDKN